jgi:hypothetical protein
MPRGPRLDVEGGVYHVMALGVERRAIFRDDTDSPSGRRDSLDARRSDCLCSAGGTPPW